MKKGFNMKKTRNMLLLTLQISSIILLITTCSMEIIDPFQNDINPEMGRLSLSLGEHTGSRTIYPSDFNLGITDYVITGAGPESATFSEIITATNMPARDLAVGEWIITAQARNDAGDILGEGQSPVTIESAVVAETSITIIPSTGTGTLNLSLSWPITEITNPSITATLTPEGGSSSTLTFNIDSGEGNADYNGTLDNGFYDVTIKLYEDSLSSPSWGIFEGLLIVKDQTTSQHYSVMANNLNLPPDVPSALEITSISSSDIVLSWSDNSSVEEKMILERKAGTGSFIQLIELSNDTTDYTDSSGNADTIYTYRLLARNNWGDSGYSGEVSTVPAAPSTLSASEGLDSITLSWTDNASLESGYILERSPGNNTSFAVYDNTITADTTEYTDISVNPDFVYYYRIKAAGYFGHSGYSGESSSAVEAPDISNIGPTPESKVNHPRVSYTLSDTASSGTITWIRTDGMTDVGSPHQKTLTGTELDSGSHNAITLTNSPTLVSGAVYTITFTVADTFGNERSVNVTNITYDSEALENPVFNGSTVSPTNNPMPTWNWNDIPGSINYRYGWSEGSWLTSVAIVSEYTPSSVLNEGDHKLYVQAKDAAGNWSSSGFQVINVDTVAPDAPTVIGPTVTNDTTPTWEWNNPAGIVKYRYGYAEDSWIAETTNWDYTPSVNLSEDSHTLYVQGCDLAGNWSDSGSKTIEVVAALTVSTASVKNMEATSATGSGNITSDGGSAITERGICWSTNPNPTINDYYKADSVATTGSYSCLMTGLTPGTSYYVKAYATNGVETGYSSQESFETMPVPPSTPSVSPVPFSSGSGKLDVSWTSVNGSSTYFDVYYSTSTTPPDLPNGPTDLSATSCTLTGLDNYTDYYVWIKAKNTTGSSGLSTEGTSMVGIKVASISFDKSPQTLIFGSIETMVATCNPPEATNLNINWSTNNADVAIVSDGIITVGNTAAAVTITATAADGQGAYSNIVPISKAYVQYQPGPAGGLLLYDKGSYSEGWRFLEMAEVNVGSGHAWFNGSNIDITGAVNHLLGAGKENTDAIIAAQGAGTYLAMDCRNYTNHGYSDWYMPSAGEANEIVVFLGFNIPGLWGVSSSSQKTDDNRACYTYCFNAVSQSWGWNWILKSSSSAVTRPVRRF